MNATDLAPADELSADAEARLIEVMARAAHRAFLFGRDRWDNAKPLVQERFRDEARASVAAVREHGLGGLLG